MYSGSPETGTLGENSDSMDITASCVDDDTQGEKIIYRKLDYNRYKEYYVWAREYQLIDTRYPLRDIHADHINDHTASID